MSRVKFQALVYDILPSTTAVFSYAMWSRKLSTNEQFFVGAQTVVSLLQTTQIISDFCFITDHVAYASSNKTNRRSELEHIFRNSFWHFYRHVGRWNFTDVSVFVDSATPCFTVKPYSDWSSVVEPSVCTVRNPVPAGSAIDYSALNFKAKFWTGKSRLACDN